MLPVSPISQKLHDHSNCESLALKNSIYTKIISEFETIFHKQVSSVTNISFLTFARKFPRKRTTINYIFSLLQNQQIRKYMSMPFPDHQFRHALSRNSKIKTSLQPFLHQFRKNNMQWIFAAISQLTDYLTDPKIEIKLTLNSLLALKFILDNANVIMTHVIETYLLPTIFEIASFQFNNDGRRGERYFISKGYIGDTNQLESKGYNFVHIAQQIIKAAPQIKPNFICFDQEIQEPSQFQLSLKELQKRGFESFKSFMFYEVSIIKETRNSFLKSLETYSQEITPFKQFFENFTKEYLAKGIESKTKISPFKLLEKGEATAVQIVVKECLKSLRSADLTERTRALSLMNELVLWGDITVAYQINCEGSINEAVREVTETKEKGVGLGLERAAKVLKGYQNSDKEKEEYYRVLLKCVKLWGKCYPTAINSIDRVSNIKFLCGQLQKQSIHFPDYENIFADQALFEANRRKRLQRNERLYICFLRKDNQQRGSLLGSIIFEPSVVQQKRLTAQSFSKELQKVKFVLDNIGQDQQKVPQNMQVLSRFFNQFETMIQTAKLHYKDLQVMINQGIPVLQKIEFVTQYLYQYQTKQISFNAFKTLLYQKNRELKITHAEKSSTTSSYQFSPTLQTNSYRLNNLQKPKIFQTESKEYTLEEILRTNGKNDWSARRRSTTSPQHLLFNLQTQNLMHSKQFVQKGSPNCMKLMNKLQSLSQYKESAGTTFKPTQFSKVSRHA